MFNEALTYPKFREVISTSSCTANYLDGTGASVSQTWMVSNKYINGEEETPAGLTVLGGKTGTTQAAGNCLVMASTAENGDEYISVVMKAGSRPALYENMTNIIRKIVE